MNDFLTPKAILVHTILFLTVFTGSSFALKMYSERKAEVPKIICPQCGYTNAEQVKP